MEKEKSSVLVAGGTGYIGRRMVRASLAQGHPTFVLMRPEIGLNVDKLQLLLSFKAQGARLLEASLDDHWGLVAAVRHADVVVSALSNLLTQLKLVEAIKEAGNVKNRSSNSSTSMRNPSRPSTGNATPAPPSTTIFGPHVRPCSHHSLLSSLGAFAQEFSHCPSKLPPKRRQPQIQIWPNTRRRAPPGKKMRFLPSEFGMDPAKMAHALPPGRVTFDEKMVIRRAIEDANIPHTYVSANCFAAYFCANLGQLCTLLPPKEKVHVYGDGNVKVIFMDEDDVGTYTIKSVDDPRTLNKTIYLRPPENILTQNELIAKWENLSGKVLEKIPIPADEFLASMKDADYFHQIAVGHFYHIFYEGCLTNFEIGDDGEEASQLYPEVEYTRMDEYMNRYL